MQPQAKLALLKRMIDRVSDHYNLGEVTLGINEELGNEINASASQVGQDIKLSPGALKQETKIVLAIIAHELGHLICCHSSAGHIQEFEADWEAVNVLEILGFSAQSLEQALTLLLDKALGGDDGFVTPCHPDMKTRFENIKAVIKEKKKVQ